MKKPPIENRPTVEARPKCPWCQRALRPVVNEEFARKDNGHSDYNKMTRRFFDGSYHGYPHHTPTFCTILCGMRFAFIAYRDGVRIKR